MGLVRDGIDVIGESQLVGYPTQFPSVSMMNWKTGKPNARYWVLKLIKDNFGPGDALVNTGIAGDGIVAQGFATSRGHRVLLINRSDRQLRLAVPPDLATGYWTVVDRGTGDNQPAKTAINGGEIDLQPFAVGVLAK